MAAVLTCLASLSFAYHPIVPISASLNVHPLIDEPATPPNTSEEQQSTTAFTTPTASSPCGRSLGCAFCTCRLGGEQKLEIKEKERTIRPLRHGAPSMQIKREIPAKSAGHEDVDLSLISSWEMSQVLQNKEYLDLIRNNEREALFQLQHFLNEHPPSVVGDDVPDDMLG